MAVHGDYNVRSLIIINEKNGNWKLLRNWLLKRNPKHNGLEFWKASLIDGKWRNDAALCSESTVCLSGVVPALSAHWVMAVSLKIFPSPLKQALSFPLFHALSFTLHLFVLCLHSSIDLLPYIHYHDLSLLYARVKQPPVWEKTLVRLLHKSHTFGHI